MASNSLQPGERIDDLLINNLKIIQHQDEFCFSLDAILLAHFTTVRPGANAVDLGAGTGVLGFLLLARGAGIVTGVEIDPARVDRAERSARLNDLAARLKMVCADVRQLDSRLPAGSWQLIVANPPYRPIGSGFVSPNSQMAVARHEIAGNLGDFIAAARLLLKYRGRFAMVHLPERTAEILKALSDAGLEPKRLQFVYSAIGKKPKFLLVEAVRGAKPGVVVLPPLFVYGPDGKYSPEIMAYYQNNAPQGG